MFCTILRNLTFTEYNLQKSKNQLVLISCRKWIDDVLDKLMDLDLGLVHRDRSCRNLILVDLATQVILFRGLEDIIHISTELGLVLRVLLAPCHNSIKITLELVDMVSAVMTKEQATSNVNSGHILEGSLGANYGNLVTVARPESRLLAKTAPWLRRVWK